MLRIVEENATTDTTILRLDGRLVGEWVELLRASCEQARQSNRLLMLDLSGVSFADHAGVRLLRQLDAQEVALLHGSAFLREQMKASSNGLPPVEPAARSHEDRV